MAELHEASSAAPFLPTSSSPSPNSSRSPSPRLVFRPRIPIDIINTIVEHLESPLSVREAREEGKRLSLVSRDFRDAGQRLVFRAVTLKSLDVYSPLLRTLATRNFRLSGFVRYLNVFHLAQSDPSRTAEVGQFFDALSQVRSLVVTALPQHVSRVLALLETTRLRLRLEILTVVYRTSFDLLDFDDADFTKLQGFSRLKHFSLHFPLELSIALCPVFPDAARLRIPTFTLHLLGTVSPSVDAALATFTSLLDRNTLAHLTLSSPTTTRDFQSWISTSVQLHYLHLTFSSSLSLLLPLLNPTFHRLSRLRTLRLAQADQSHFSSRPDTDLLPLLTSLPPSLEFLAFDIVPQVHVAGPMFAGPTPVIRGFLADRLDADLRERKSTALA
ncbi:hypothetical protein JCM8097_006589 [Rhodosporidiobolus ruineniae]